MIKILDFYLKKVHSLLINNSFKTQLILLKQYNVSITVIDFSLKSRKLFDLLIFFDIKFKYYFYLKKTKGIVFILGSNFKPEKSIKKFLKNYLHRDFITLNPLEIIINEIDIENISI